jgi:hypothetical protein
VLPRVENLIGDFFAKDTSSQRQLARKPLLRVFREKYTCGFHKITEYSNEIR